MSPEHEEILIESPSLSRYKSISPEVELIEISPRFPPILISPLVELILVLSKIILDLILFVFLYRFQVIFY